MRDLEHLRRRYADHVPGLLGARHSYAVLCPLVERPDGLHLLFEVRSAALHRQPGARSRSLSPHRTPAPRR